MNSTLAAYIRAQLTACLFIGIVCAVGFTLLGLPSPLVLGLIAGVFEFVPLVGPLMIAVSAAILAMLHAGPFSALMVIVFLVVLRIVQDYAVYPRLIGQGIHLASPGGNHRFAFGRGIGGRSWNFSGDSGRRNSHRELPSLARTSRAARLWRTSWNPHPVKRLRQSRPNC